MAPCQEARFGGVAARGPNCGPVFTTRILRPGPRRVRWLDPRIGRASEDGHSRFHSGGEYPRMDVQEDRGRWRMLAIVGVGELLAMAPWFSASAVAPLLTAEWGLDRLRLPALTVAVPLGVAAGGAGRPPPPGPRRP